MDSNLIMTKGDTMSFGLQFINQPVELSEAFFSVKRNYDDADYVFQKTLGNGISKISDNQYEVRVAPEDTDDLDAGYYYYDFQVGANGDKFTFLRGMLTLLPEVTEE